MELSLCVSSTTSIALKPFTYSIHGHDVVVEACWCLDSIVRVDIEDLALILEASLDKFKYKPLWEVLGRSDAMIEDMLLELSRSIKSPNGLRLCRLTARWSSRMITLHI